MASRDLLSLVFIFCQRYNPRRFQGSMLLFVCTLISSLFIFYLPTCAYWTVTLPSVFYVNWKLSGNVGILVFFFLFFKNVSPCEGKAMANTCVFLLSPPTVIKMHIETIFHQIDSSVFPECALSLYLFFFQNIFFISLVVATVLSRRSLLRNELRSAV